MISVRIGFLFLFCAGVLCRAQDQVITVKDEVDLAWIENAWVKVFDETGLLLDSGFTGANGRYSWGADLAADRISLQHPDYLDLELSLTELAKRHFQVFLASKTYSFNEVVFTANKYREQKEDIPYQIDVIKPQDIDLRNPQTSADLLQQKGSIFVQKSQMGGGSPNLRGFEANKVLLVVDGVRMNNAIYRSGHLQNVLTIDPHIIGRTEVMFGPSSVMYGSDALGGVMHFYTRKPEFGLEGQARIKGQALLRYGTVNQEKTGHVDLNLGFKNWGSLTSISFSDFGDLHVGKWRPSAYPDFGKRLTYVERVGEADVVKQNDEVNRMRTSGYSQIDLMQKFTVLSSPRLSHQLNLQFSTTTDIPRFDRLTQTYNGTLRYAEWNYGPQTRFMANYQLKHSQETGLYDQITLTTAYQHVKESRHTRSLNVPIRNNRIESLDILSINLDANKLLVGAHELAYGVEFTSNWIHSSAFTEHILSAEIGRLDTRYPDGGSFWRSAAAYFTHRWEINPQLTLTEGLRYSDLQLHSRFQDKTFFPFDFDSFTQNNRAFSGNLGLVMKGEKGLRMALLASTGFRAPNLDDAAKVFDSQPGNVVIPNPDLTPEYTYNGELTLSKQWNESLKIEVTGFYTYYTNAIVVRKFQLNGQDSIFYDGVMSQVQANVNAGKAYIAGFTTGLEAFRGPFTFSHTLTFTYGQELSTDVPMDHIPPLFGQGMIRYQQGAFRAELSVPYQGWKRPGRYSPRDVNNAEFATEEGWPAWWTVNLKSTWKLTPMLKLQLGVENILDRHYRPFSSRISAPGRNFVLAVRTNF